MVIPTLVLMVPVTIVSLMAPIPKMLFGHLTRHPPRRKNDVQ